MRVLSLFDGISCGRLALERAGIKVDSYDAYEIDEKAIFVSQNNWKDIEHHGNVVGADFTQYVDVDLLIAGFPCQDLSIANTNRKGLNGNRSGLFWELVRAIDETKPKYFLVENNYKMPQEDMDVISKTLGVEPILINSGLVSAQSRNRLYWTNIPNVCLPLNKHIYLKDIIDYNYVSKENYCDITRFNGNDEHNSDKPLRIGTIGKGGQGERVYSVYGKAVTQSVNGGGLGAKGGLYLINGVVRKPSVVEAERLQTLPDNYTIGLKDTDRKKAIGNGWTVDVIAHIFSGLKE